jgi:hypothetical protein
MATKSWTELFFLDEATALAAGHRPCFLCRRDAAQAFRMAWAAGHGGQLPAAPQIDAVLHSERVQGGAKRIHALTYGVAELPDGAMISARDQAFVMTGGCPLLWTAGGYRPISAPLRADGLITPPATVGALRFGPPGAAPLRHGFVAGPGMIRHWRSGNCYQMAPRRAAAGW